MAARTAFKSVDTAFAILFLLLAAVTILNVSTVAGMGQDGDSLATQDTATQLAQHRSLERTLRHSVEYLRDESVSTEAKRTFLDFQLDNLRYSFRELGITGSDVAGLTRVVEPYEQIKSVSAQLTSHPEETAKLLAFGGPVDRALNASLYVVRNNITRLGEELASSAASQIGTTTHARRTAVICGIAALLVFAPVRLMAGRAAAKPIRQLKAATRAVSEERWHACGIELSSDDAVGELVSAFNTMAGKLRESREERANAFQRTLAALVQTIEAKDTFTSNHSCNVAKLAEMLAREVGLPKSQVKEIVYGALLHDIGKIGIPDEIINKPGALTREEFKEIQQHPVIGNRIITPLEDAETLVPSVRHHHEHWDGTGYPDGLSGDGIPLMARIITVADVFEALTSDRPYRDRMPIERAVAILEEESGKTLDPALVERFVVNVVPKIQRDWPVTSRNGDVRASIESLNAECDDQSNESTQENASFTTDA